MALRKKSAVRQRNQTSLLQFNIVLVRPTKRTMVFTRGTTTHLRFVQELDRDADRASELAHLDGGLCGTKEDSLQKGGHETPMTTKTTACQISEKGGGEQGWRVEGQRWELEDRAKASFAAKLLLSALGQDLPKVDPDPIALFLLPSTLQNTNGHTIATTTTPLHPSKSPGEWPAPPTPTYAASTTPYKPSSNNPPNSSHTSPSQPSRISLKNWVHT